MKLLKVVLLLSLTNPIFLSAQDFDFERRFYNSVELNSSLKAEIGETLIFKGQEDYSKGIKIVECPIFNINFVKFPYKAGDILPFFKVKKEYDLYFSPDKIGYLDAGTIGIAFDNKKNIYVPYIQSFNGFLTKDQKGKLKVEDSEYIDRNCNDCFKKVFIYNGKSSNVVKFTYREFINDMARPAFTQELQYDLNDGNVIGFKGLRIEIVKTDNIGIEYKVLSTFD